MKNTVFIVQVIGYFFMAKKQQKINPFRYILYVLYNNRSKSHFDIYEQSMVKIWNMHLF